MASMYSQPDSNEKEEGQTDDDSDKEAEVNSGTEGVRQPQQQQVDGDIGDAAEVISAAEAALTAGSQDAPSIDANLAAKPTSSKRLSLKSSSPTNQPGFAPQVRLLCLSCVFLGAK